MSFGYQSEPNVSQTCLEPLFRRPRFLGSSGPGFNIFGINSDLKINSTPCLNGQKPISGSRFA